MKLPKKQSGGGDSWMNTYADMVTLLMCFFVMLFAMSSLDKAKWITFVKSINPKSNSQQVVIGSPPEGEHPEADDAAGDSDEVIENLEQLAKQLQEFIEQNNISGDVDITADNGYIFITFRNNLFFDGNSSALRPENTVILDFLAEGLSQISDDEIKEIRVMGHTNQDNPIERNNIDIDRELSSLRAAHVVSYLQKRNAVDDPKMLFGIGYGQWYPIAPYDTPQNRQLNRRVEILIAKSNATELSLEEIYAKIYNTDPELAQGTTQTNPDIPPEDLVDRPTTDIPPTEPQNPEEIIHENTTPPDQDIGLQPNTDDVTNPDINNP